MDPIVWRNTMGQFASGVTIITTIDSAGNPLGMTANAFTSLSLDPPMVLICVDNKSTTLVHLTESAKYCVNILAAPQEQLSRQFARKGGSEKFEGASYFSGDIGVPVLEGTLTSVECEVTAIVDGGDHKILLGKSVKIHQSLTETEPLIFYKGKYNKLEKLEVQV
ncbi:flavin reductase family protein [Paenibacillus endoradicis]|uniref:flavin reductase family protein n=1 Tax=Paenibacillus endoradicis TaxID=2972487 RepID=UPI002158D028|nr:flavin reductase family protein [Paenibacillus endoradicis]MCR8659926.1 flavin reductase family protein [Paenibacillus endoradicis]